MNKKLIFSILCLTLFSLYAVRVKPLYPNIERGSYKLSRIYCKEDEGNDRKILSRYTSKDDVEKSAAYSLDFDNIVKRIVHVDFNNFSLLLSTEGCTSRVDIPITYNGNNILQMNFGGEIAYERNKQCFFVKDTHGKLRSFNEDGDFYSRGEFMEEYWSESGNKIVSASVSKRGNSFLLTFTNSRRVFIPCKEVVWRLDPKN